MISSTRNYLFKRGPHSPVPPGAAHGPIFGNKIYPRQVQFFPEIIFLPVCAQFGAA
jgi:hypothetical protein